MLNILLLDLTSRWSHLYGLPRLAPWGKPVRGYRWKCSPVAIEDPNILEMLVPWDDHQGQRYTGGVEPRRLSVCVAEGRAREVTQGLWRSQEDHEWIPDNWTLNYLYCQILVFLGWDCDSALVLPSFFLYFFWFCFYWVMYFSLLPSLPPPSPSTLS